MECDQLNYRIGANVDASLEDSSALIFHLLPPAKQAVGEKLVDIAMKTGEWVVFRAEVQDIPDGFYDRIKKVLHCDYRVVTTHRLVNYLPDYDNMPFSQLSKTALHEVWRRIKRTIRNVSTKVTNHL